MSGTWVPPTTYATRLVAEAVEDGRDGEAILPIVGKQLDHSSIKITVEAQSAEAEGSRAWIGGTQVMEKDVTVYSSPT